MAVEELSSNEFQVAVAGIKPVLVCFSAQWCPACRAQENALEALSNSVSGSARVVKINVDNNHALAQRYRIRSIPQSMLFRGSTEPVYRFSPGVHTQSEFAQELSRLHEASAIDLGIDDAKETASGSDI